jgi:hypothetical protein
MLDYAAPWCEIPSGPNENASPSFPPSRSQTGTGATVCSTSHTPTEAHIFSERVCTPASRGKVLHEEHVEEIAQEEANAWRH